MKNLAEVETREKRAAGAAKDTKTLSFEFAWHLKKNGYSNATIESYTRQIKALINRGGRIFDPESVKELISKQERWNEATKNTTVALYTTFLKMHGMTWDKPKYKPRAKIPFIPTEKDIDDLIACCGRKTGAALRIAKETGARSGEISKIKWADIDEERRIIRINEPEKGSNPRIISITTDLINALQGLPKKSEYIFSMKDGEIPMTSAYLGHLLYQGRKTAARKLGNPRLNMITFQIIRHWKGTTEYHKTRDILHVKSILGHKNIRTLWFASISKGHCSRRKQTNSRSEL